MKDGLKLDPQKFMLAEQEMTDNLLVSGIYKDRETARTVVRMIMVYTLLAASPVVAPFGRRAARLAATRA